ncbi:hypothetical protein IKB17_02140 [bacterium]|nr:hypothetical protein [bacterium]
MEINNFYNYNNYNNYSPNFKQVNLVKIKKSAFANPNNLHECQFRLDSVLKSFSKSKIGNKLLQILTFIGLGNLATKFVSILENPGFINIQEVLEKQKFCASIDWLRLNTQTEIPDVIDPNAHSFYVLTGKDKNDYMAELNMKNLFKIIDEVREISAEKTFSDQDIAECFAVAKTCNLFNNRFNESIKDKPVKTFELESLEQLNEIAKDLKI